MTARALLLLALASPAAASDLRVFPAMGLAWFERGVSGQHSQTLGAALELRLESRADQHLGFATTFAWGLTDWDRAREWIDAGNRAGSWTTDKFADVEAWVRNGKGNDTEGLRAFAAMFADMFLVFSYVAVPVCYVGSIGGATSYLQLDFTGSFHLSDGPSDAWVEFGGGAAALPERTFDPEPEFVFHRAVGPVGGIGARFGPLRVVARALWSPPALNTSGWGGTVLASTLTLSIVR